MVCTGGIRCSVSGRYLKQKGFKDVKMVSNSGSCIFFSLPRACMYSLTNVNSDFLLLVRLRSGSVYSSREASPVMVALSNQIRTRSRTFWARTLRLTADEASGSPTTLSAHVTSVRRPTTTSPTVLMRAATCSLFSAQAAGKSGLILVDLTVIMRSKQGQVLRSSSPTITMLKSAQDSFRHPSCQKLLKRTNGEEHMLY